MKNVNGHAKVIWDSNCPNGAPCTSIAATRSSAGRTIQRRAAYSKGSILNATFGPFEGETGRAQWCSDAGKSLMTGHWHVQCVDNENTEPEDGIFAADDNP